MSFYLSKILQAFLLPPGAFLALFALFLKQKKLFIALLVLFYIVSTQKFGMLLLAPLENPYKTALCHDTKAQAVVVLGGGYINGVPNLPLSSDAFKRALFGLELAYKNNLPLYFDGTPKEAFAVKQTLDELTNTFDLNISYEKREGFFVHLGKSAKTTIDNAKNIKKALPNTKVYLVTSAYHMKRASDEFKRVGVAFIPCATDFKVSSDFNFQYFLPSATGLKYSYIALHEYLGLLRNALFR